MNKTDEISSVLELFFPDVIIVMKKTSECGRELWACEVWAASDGVVSKAYFEEGVLLSLDSNEGRRKMRSL